MPVIKRENIDRSIRAPHEKKYKAQLKKALHDPMLTPEETDHIKEQLASLGKAKVYRRNSPPKPGAIDLT